MWLFLTAIAIVIIIYNRRFIKSYAKGVKSNGVTINLGEYKKRYPRFSKKIEEYLDSFNREYQRTFVYENATTCLINTLYSLRSDVLIHINEIKFRLPNDLAGEKELANIYESADRMLMEHIDDAKARFNIFISPGQVSSAYMARNYRASNDIVA